MTPRITLTLSRSSVGLVEAAGVVKCLAGHHQAEQLRGVGRLDRIGGDAEVEQREIDRRRENRRDGRRSGRGPWGRWSK